ASRGYRGGGGEGRRVPRVRRRELRDGSGARGRRRAHGMKLAFLFGGQGTELPRMGLDIAERVPAASALLDTASEVTGVDAREVLALAGPELRRTSVIQPLLVAVGLGAHAALAEAGIAPAIVAGHSLGELTAWAAAGALGAREAIALAAARG